jgi:hypothetical protein
LSDFKDYVCEQIQALHLEFRAELPDGQELELDDNLNVKVLVEKMSAE